MRSFMFLLVVESDWVVPSDDSRGFEATGSTRLSRPLHTAALDFLYMIPPYEGSLWKFVSVRIRNQHCIFETEAP